MTGEWRTCRLGDLVDIFDGPHATPPKAPSGPVFLGISNLVGGRVNLLNAEHLSEADFLRWTRRVTPQSGDVVFSYETQLGEAAVVPQGLRCCLGRRMGLLRPRNNAVDPRFLLYAYLGDEFQETLRQRTVRGSTVDRIPLLEMAEFPIRVPGFLEQRAIAHILGTLDNKIELNRQMNATLEAIVRALFKSCFIDFDPVRAKAEGRDPGLPKPVADLFPDSFEDSELGEIPSGWSVQRWGDLVTLEYGRGLTGYNNGQGSYPIYYESRLAKLELKESERPRIDPEFEEATEGEEVERKEKLKKIIERCRLLYGSPRRLAELKIYAFKRYQDHRRYLALEREYVQRMLGRLASP